jgi:hypothetical protein
MTYNEMVSITEQFENMGLFYDTGKRCNGKVKFRCRVPSPEKMEELCRYVQCEPAAFEVLALAAMAGGGNPGEVSAAISKLRKLSSRGD